MEERILKREDLAQKLRDWGAGRISSEDLCRWADGLYFSDDVHLQYEDGDGELSTTNEVLAALDMLNMNLALPEDAPIYLEFLSTPPGHFEEGHSKYIQSLERIDYEERRARLKDVPFYAPYTQHRSQ